MSLGEGRETMEAVKQTKWGKGVQLRRNINLQMSTKQGTQNKTK